MLTAILKYPRLSDVYRRCNKSKSRDTEQKDKSKGALQFLINAQFDDNPENAALRISQLQSEIRETLDNKKKLDNEMQSGGLISPRPHKLKERMILSERGNPDSPLVSDNELPLSLGTASPSSALSAAAPEDTQQQTTTNNSKVRIQINTKPILVQDRTRNNLRGRTLNIDEINYFSKKNDLRSQIEF